MQCLNRTRAATELQMSQILLVEDEPLLREPLARLLRGEGFDVVLATDGQEALERMRDERPALVLLDLTMPRMDGLTFLSIVRRDPELRGVPIFLFTSITDPEALGRAREFGIEGYWVKGATPIDRVLANIREQVH